MSSADPVSPWLVSQSCVVPDKKSNMKNLKLSVSDLFLLSIEYNQKGCLFNRPPNISIHLLLSSLTSALAQTLSLFPPLAGRLFTDPKTNQIFITCNDDGVEFIHAAAFHISIRDIITPTRVPKFVESFFPLDRKDCYSGHFDPILTVQVTELADGVFIGCSVNHAVIDGTSFWNFFNTFAELTRGVKRLSVPSPDFDRTSILVSNTAVLKPPNGGPKVTYDDKEPLSERIFSFSREAILKIKAKANNKKSNNDDRINAVKLLGNGKFLEKPVQLQDEISSFQSLCALLWRVVTRARNLPKSKTTTFKMRVNCRHRLEPNLNPMYFGNAIQNAVTRASVDDVLSRDLHWCGAQLNHSVKAHDNTAVKLMVENWEKDPHVLPVGIFDGASISMGGSSRFPMYDSDFGWGRPLAIRSGRVNKFNGRMAAYPGLEGIGSIDLEVVLSPETMAAVEYDYEFMQYVS